MQSETTRREPIRLAVRLFFFAAAIVLLWPVLQLTGAAKFVLMASPFLAVCSSISHRHIEIGAIIGLAFAFAAIFQRRFFCRYICPTGLLQEGASRIGISKTSWWAKCPPIGKYVALLTLFGAVAGYPLLLWLDPLALFGSFFTIKTAVSIYYGFLSGLGLGILLLLSLTSGRFWCTRLCPLGGTQDMLASAKSLFRKKGDSASEPKKEIIPMRRALLLGTAGVGIGLLAGKTGVARGEVAPLRPPGAVREGAFTGLCTRCGNCVRACPSGIIQQDWGQAGIWGIMAPVIRFENNFCQEDCAECTNVCPSGALQQLSLEQKRHYKIGEAVFDGTFCYIDMECNSCLIACPFNAIQLEWNEELYGAYPLVDASKCNGCGACETACPGGDTRNKAIRVVKLADDHT